MEFLHRLWKAWQNIVLAIANVLARVVLTLFYFSILFPFGLGVRLFGDPLKLKKIQPPLWQNRETGDQQISDALKQS